jgi:uncharacterized membrane protein
MRRSAFAALAFLLLILSIVPFIHGYWLVPAFSLAAVAALTFALERHQKQAAPAETLEVGPGRLRHADSRGRVTECEGPWLSFRVEAPTPSALRLLVRTAADVVEIGRCLSLDERRAVAPVIAAALDAATESRRERPFTLSPARAARAGFAAGHGPPWPCASRRAGRCAGAAAAGRHRRSALSLQRA